MRSPLQSQVRKWHDAVVDGVDYRVCQLDLEDGQFTLDDAPPRSPGRKWFSAGSWLIMGPGDQYARAMTNEEYLKWSGVKPGMSLR